MPTQFSQFINGGTLQAGDRAVGLRNELNTLFDIGALNGGTLSRQITLAAHGFALSTIIAINNAGVLIRADATSPLTAEVIGIVSNVIDVNTFELQFGGYLTNLAVPVVAGNVYFLSDAAAGTYTNVPPVAVGHVRKALFIADSNNSGYWWNYPGQIL